MNRKPHQQPHKRGALDEKIGYHNSRYSHFTWTDVAEEKSKWWNQRAIKTTELAGRDLGKFFVFAKKNFSGQQFESYLTVLKNHFGFFHEHPAAIANNPAAIANGPALCAVSTSSGATTIGETPTKETASNASRSSRGRNTATSDEERSEGSQKTDLPEPCKRPGAREGRRRWGGTNWFLTLAGMQGLFFGALLVTENPPG